MTVSRTHNSRHPALWGDPDAALPADTADGVAQLLADRFPRADLTPEPPADWHDVAVSPPIAPLPDALGEICATDQAARVLHATGRSFSDLVQARRGVFGRVPDVVATPRNAAEVNAVLDWCQGERLACIPFGGGTSVVGGVNPPADPRGVVTLQTRAMDRVLAVDPVSRAAHIEAGATGPRLEEQLRPHGLTLRFFPQSFEYSTLGGWIATRAGGHYATRLTHIDDLVEAVTAVTPTGLWASVRLPASGAGPSPDRLLLGSEGTLGVITDAWVRLQQRPTHRATRSVAFPSFAVGAAAVRDIVQAGFEPAGCRLLDPTEAALNGAGNGAAAILMLSFESATESVESSLQVALGLCRDAGGHPVPAGETEDPAGKWRGAFMRAPYLRDVLLSLGMVVETFETATTWDRFDNLVGAVLDAALQAATEVCGDAIVTCRITHAYADGAAPYFTVIAPGRRGSEVEQWRSIKQAASEAVVAAGGTITHHHAVGRDHRPWYDGQRPAPFARALAAAKDALDPAGILNPGVLLDVGGSA